MGEYRDAMRLLPRDNPIMIGVNDISMVCTFIQISQFLEYKDGMQN
jgi:hypothetical protein